MRMFKLLSVGVAVLVSGCATRMAETRVQEPPMPPTPPVMQRTQRAAAAMSSVASASETNSPAIIVRWSENAPIERVIGYNIFIRGTNDWTAVEHVARPPLDIYPRMQAASNGVYRVSATAVNNAGLESKESAFVLFWYGQPTEPQEMTVEFVW